MREKEVLILIYDKLPLKSINTFPANIFDLISRIRRKYLHLSKFLIQKFSVSMTGIADLYLLIKRPNSKEARARIIQLFKFHGSKYEFNRFVVLSWKRTGSNLLCGVLFNHPEIAMHNEIFNPIDIFTYYRKALVRNEDGDKWSSLGRDLYPEAFLEHIWTGKDMSGTLLKETTKSVGFKSFPDHWWEAKNDHVFQQMLMDDPQVKKIILFREDELAVYISMKRAEKTGHYMTLPYPEDLKIHVDPVAFQIFINNYRDTFRRRYKSVLERQNTFRISYEQLIQTENLKENILPKLWDFLGVDNTQPLKKLRETVKQAEPSEDLSSIIENYKELEFCFRHTDVTHFQSRHDLSMKKKFTESEDEEQNYHKNESDGDDFSWSSNSWSILLPICSRGKKPKGTECSNDDKDKSSNTFNSNRFIDLSLSSQHDGERKITSCEINACWEHLFFFAESLKKTSSPNVLTRTECLIGIDLDDPVFFGEEAKKQIRKMLPCEVRFFEIPPTMYGKVCKIWNHLAKRANNNFIVLLGDDIVLKTKYWQEKVVAKFQSIAETTGLPFGVACVALNDESFHGFPTFPVVHKWHIEKFRSILPKQFVNQGGDPYLYELYSRFNTACFAVDCQLKNTIGGDGDARYKKHEVNWRGQILRLGIMHMKEHLNHASTGICLDIVVPSYRIKNNEILKSIIQLQCSKQVYIKFWIVVDNPNTDHILEVKKLANMVNKERFDVEGNYFVNVLHYEKNQGASFARNLGYNYSTADWILFLDDDVIPSSHLLDAYVGAILRYPKAKVFVGNTELPVASNTWTKMLRTCNIMFFYGVSKHRIFPPWGVTANLMVRGSRHNGTIQFKDVYPKTGGGEDIDFCFQFKKWYKELPQSGLIVGVPSAVACHPWWNGGGICYNQINGWATGDSLCITEWPEKCFWSFPNWIEFILCLLIPLLVYFDHSPSECFLTSLIVACIESFLLTIKYYSSACIHSKGSFFYRVFVAFGAGTVLSFQEATRVKAHLFRGHFHCLLRRVDWNDGQDSRVKLDTQLSSFLRFALYSCISYVVVRTNFKE